MEPQTGFHAFKEGMMSDWEDRDDRDLDNSHFDGILVEAKADVEEGSPVEDLIELYEEAMETIVAGRFCQRAGGTRTFIQYGIELINAFSDGVPKCEGHPLGASLRHKKCMGLAMGAIMAGPQGGEGPHEILVVCEKEVHLSLPKGTEALSMWRPRDEEAMQVFATAAATLKDMYTEASEEDAARYDAFLEAITAAELEVDVDLTDAGEDTEGDEVLELRARLRDAQIQTQKFRKIAELKTREAQRARKAAGSRQRRSPHQGQSGQRGGGMGSGGMGEPTNPAELSVPQQQYINDLIGIEACNMSIVKKWQALTPEQRQRVVGGGEGVMLQASDLYSTKERETYADTEQTTVATITKFCAHALRQYGTRDMLRGQSRALRVAFGMVHGVRTTMFDVLHDRSASIEYHGSLDKLGKVSRATRGIYPSDLSQAKTYQRGGILLENLASIANKEALALKDQLSFTTDLNHYDLMEFLLLQWKAELEYNTLTCPRGAYRHLFLRRLVDFERGCRSVEEFVKYFDGFLHGRTDQRFPSDRRQALCFSKLKGYGPAANEFLIGNTNTLPVIDPEHRVGFNDPPVPMTDAETARCRAAVFSDPVFVEMVNMIGPALKASPTTRQRDQAVGAVSKLKSLCDSAISTMAKGPGRE
jgi:hypothetical protein